MGNFSNKLWICLLLMLLFCLCTVGCNGSNTQPEYINNQTENEPAPSADISVPPAENIQQESVPENTNIPSATDPGIPDTQPANTVPSESTEPEETTTEPEESTTSPENNEIDPLAQAYINYYNMSADEQQKFIDSFGSIEAFFAWHTSAKQAYENNRTPIDGSKPIIP